jgi:hypothetical protein
MQALMPDVRPGDQLLGIYVPDQETRFFHNGQPIGTIPDPAFGPEFFAIWLDKKTSEPDLRVALLGMTCNTPIQTARNEADSCADATIPVAHPPLAEEPKS